MIHHLDLLEWDITIVDQDETHYYQPGFLFIPFGIYGPNDVIKPKRFYIPAGVNLIMSPLNKSSGKIGSFGQRRSLSGIRLPRHRHRDASCAGRKLRGWKGRAGGRYDS